VTRNQFEHAIAVLTGQAPAGFSIPSLFPSAPPPPPANGGAPTLQTPPVIDYSKLAPPPIPVGVPSTLLERRPDIAGQERSVAAANANIGLARTAWYPELTLGASAGLTSGSMLNLLTWGSRVWSVGPSLAQTIFDAGKRRAQLRQNIAAYDATAAGYRQTVLSAFQQVEDGLSTLQVLAREAQQQALAVDASVKSLNLEIERYRAGTDSYLNVITTQQIELTNARTAVSLHQERMTTSVNLILALGGGWDQSALPTPDQLRSGGLEDPAKTVNVAQPVTK
jgi:NodT family efflux transporter outer membrane factor (OMF) lipoprotein